VRYDELTSTRTQGRRLGQAYLAQLPFTAVVRNQIRRRVKELRGRRWRRRCGEGEGPKEQRVARAPALNLPLYVNAERRAGPNLQLRSLRFACPVQCKYKKRFFSVFAHLKYFISIIKKEIFYFKMVYPISIFTKIASCRLLDGRHASNRLFGKDLPNGQLRKYLLLFNNLGDG
jgi:hypothetical protein